MRTKNIIIALFTAGTLIAGTGAAFAHGPKGERANVEKRVEKMTKNLNLDAAQSQKIRSILENSKRDLESLREAEGERAEKKEQAKLIRESSRAEIQAVLTPAQLENAQKMRADRKEKRKHMKGNHKRGKKLGHLAKELDLSDNQKVEVRKITKTAHEDIRTIVRDDFGGDRKSAKEAVQVRRAKMVADIKAQLTPEQVEKFDALKGKRGKGKRGRKSERGTD